MQRSPFGTRPVITDVGGICGVPIAWRTMPPTMTSFANEVIIVNTKGISPIAIRIASHETMLQPPPAS